MSKQLTGTVVSTKMNKTIVVRVERKLRHPLYRKVIMKYKKFKAHYEGSDLKEGDSVTIRETSPISKEKHFIVVENTVKNEEVKKTEAVKVKKIEKVQEAKAEVTMKPEKKTVKTVKKETKKVTKVKAKK